MTREVLKTYKHNQEFIDDQLEYVERQKSSLEKITTTLNDMPVGSRKVEDSMAEKLVKLMDKLNQLLDYIYNMQEKQNEIMEQLMQVEQPYLNILYKVYIQGKSLVKTADELSYSYEHMKHMHGIALLKFDELNTKSY